MDSNPRFSDNILNFAPFQNHNISHQIILNTVNEKLQTKTKIRRKSKIASLVAITNPEVGCIAGCSQFLVKFKFSFVTDQSRRSAAVDLVVIRCRMGPPCTICPQAFGAGIPVTRVSNGIGGKAEFDTLGKTVSAHRAGGHTPHEGWVPRLRCVEGGRGGEFPPLTHHK